MSRPSTRTRHAWWCLLIALAAVMAAGRYAADSMTPTSDLGADRGGKGTLIPIAYRPIQQIPGGLEGGVDWINTAGPIHLQDLRGKLVLLDFWTYCCINCHHVLPDLAYLEKKYPNELVVIGVHTAKFDAEKKTENIRKKVAEYRIQHPVINDANQTLWRRFGVNSWPTLVLIDAKGKYVGSAAGEGNREVLDKVIGRLIAEHKAAGELDTKPIKFFPENEKPHNGPLLYPGKVLADAEGNRLFITDTGHNRIVVTDLEGRHLATIGNGATGLSDGSYEQASFNRPQGTCLKDGVLYVADTENHAIRAVDLAKKQVRTIAGTGEQSYMRSGGGPGRRTGLNSPWDVIALPGTDTLAIAMAGPHQIWQYDLKTERVSVWAGTGREDIIDGPIEDASFAQPSGLATDGKHLFVADSEGSAIRSITLNGANRVGTIAGTHDLPNGASLFAFGDRDAKTNNARLQHCLGVAYGDGKLYIADTYNNKVKYIDLGSGQVHTLAGSREAGGSDKPTRFDEPGGVSLAGNRLFVADTNNHAIRVLDLEAKVATTLTLSGVEAPTPPPSKPKFPNAIAIELPPAKVAPGSQFTLDVALALSDGFKINPEAPMPILLEAPANPTALRDTVSPNGSRIEPPKSAFEVVVPLAKPAAPGDTLEVKLSVSAFECKEGAAGLCRVKNFVWTIPVTFEAGSPDRITLRNEPQTARR